MPSIKQKSLEIDITPCDGGNLFKMSGEINEDLIVDELVDFKAEIIKVDFQNVKMINSCGVREWIKLVEALANQGSKVEYHNCPQIVIQQVNMVTGFIPDAGQVVTFYAPYFCDECEHEEKLLLTSTELEGRQAPEHKCGNCGATSEIDAMEDVYLNFIPE
jgi:ABC-type transporter Mla MlaB component